MEITTELDWDSNDIAALKNFLATKTGLRCVPKILESCPTLLSGGEVNALLVRNGEVRGFSMAVQALLALTSPPALPSPPEKSAYPPLDADDQWNDGQSLTSKSIIPHA